MLKFNLLIGMFLTLTCSLTAQRELKNPLINSKEVMNNAATLYTAGKYNEAITEYLKVPVSDTNYSEILNDIALTYYADSNYTNAEKYVNTALELYPEKKASFLRLLADIYDDTKRSDQALVVYDSIIALNRYDFLTYFNKGISLYRQDKLDEAALNFQKTVMLNPYYSSGHYYLGLISLQKGNLVEAMLSFSTNLIVNPGNKHYQKSIGFLSAIAQINTAVSDHLKKFKPHRENNFEALQDIITSKIALDKKYKLKVDLEDQIVRQLQVLFEKLEYNPSDKGFWMQYYVTAFKNVWDNKQLEPLIFMMFSELDVDKVKSYIKKEKKDIEKMTGPLFEYFNNIRKTQELIVAKRETTKTKYYISNYLVMGKGEYGKNEKNEDILVGSWEFYYNSGSLKSKGTFDNKGLRNGNWYYFYETGIPKEITYYKLDKAEGKSESWHDNGLRYMLSNFKDNMTDGIEYLYYFNGQMRSAITYKNGKKEGLAKYYTANGALNNTTLYSNDLREGDEIAYYASGKLFSKATYVKEEAVGEYNEYYENGKLLKTGSFIEGKNTGLWKWFYESGQPENTGTYIKGELEGEFLSYYENGKLESRSFYKKGEIDGKKEDYDDDGVLFSETVFERRRFRDLKFFDKKGNVISNTTSRKGNADVVFYHPDGSKIREGYFNKEGMQEGKGYYYFKNGKKQTQADYKDGLIEGKKVIYYPNGKIKEEGNYSKDVADGYFVNYYNNGTVSQEGWYVAGDRQGTFLYYDELGNLATKAYYLNDRVHGIREYFTPNGKLNYTDYYDNDWFKKVVQVDTTGKVLSVSELDKGQGKVLFKHYNGQPYFESNYKYYKLNGMYKTTNADGSLSSISFYKNGEVDSTFKAWYSNGKVRMDVKYVDQKRSGEWKYYLRNGSLSEIELYEDGKLNGKDIQYNEAGTVDKEYDFKKGNVDGAVKYYADNKQLAVVLYYKEDELTGYSYEDKAGNLVPVIPIKYGKGKVIAYFKNGTKSAEMEFNESLGDGNRILYYSTGKEYVNSKRINGDDHGLKKVYYASGKIMKEENYYYGSLHGSVKHYAENGSLTADLNFYNGELHGINKYYEAGKLSETLTYYYDMLEAKK